MTSEEDRIKVEKQLEEIRCNITPDMIGFIWHEVLVHFALDRGIRPGVFTEEFHSKIVDTLEITVCMADRFIVDTVRDVVMEAVPCILKCDTLLIFSKKREITEVLIRQLAQLNQHSALWYLFKKMFIGCSTLGPICFLNPSYFKDGTFVDHLQFCLGIRKKEPPDPYSKACMSHGNFSEPVARALYERRINRKVTERGIIVNTDVSHSIGFSPDGIQWDNVGDHGDITKGSIEWIIEIKSPSSKPYNCIPNYYVGQCQAGMAVTGARYCDFISFFYKPVNKKEFDPNYEPYGKTYSLQDDECIMMVQRIFFSEKYWEYMRRCIDYFIDCLVERYVPSMEEAIKKVGQAPYFKTELIFKSELQIIPSDILNEMPYVVDV